jgi:hypothetical protein
MNIEPCPTCTGRCCVTGGNLKIHHGGGGAFTFAMSYRHNCPDCEDGTTTGDTPMPLHPAAESERAAVVAYLRELGAINAMLSPCLGVADDIESGEHRLKETK